MTSDELWDKYANDFGNIAMNRDGFLAAIAERDAYVKAEAVKVCENIGKDIVCPEECAAAIEKMELP
jgi:hypothetical protein